MHFYAFEPHAIEKLNLRTSSVHAINCFFCRKRHKYSVLWQFLLSFSGKSADYIFTCTVNFLDIFTFMWFYFNLVTVCFLWVMVAEVCVRADIYIYLCWMGIWCLINKTSTRVYKKLSKFLIKYIYIVVHFSYNFIINFSRQTNIMLAREKDC